MTEKEKSANGLLYDANHRELLAERETAKEALYHYNLLPPGKKAERRALLRSLLGRTGENFTFEPPFYCDYGYNIEIGENFFANMNLVMLDGAKITIGNNVLIAPNVGLYADGHPFDTEQRNRGLEFAYPITIGNNVWIGANVAILPGVTIGDDSVIGAGSIVARDIPPGMIAIGNPCRVLRPITQKDREKYGQV